MKEIGMYIHIPFCKQKCYYCDFVSYSNKENLAEGYVEAVLEEIKKTYIQDSIIKTIYIGGGTPSIIDSKYIVKIISKIKEIYKLDKNTEITIEVNPGTVNETKLSDYFKVGINRLSIGLQTTDNSLLKTIGRIHTYEQYLQTLNIAKNVGFTNINSDLIIGIPGQTIKTIEDTIKKLLKLNLTHISVYSLIVEENTKLEQMLKNKEITLPEETEERKMYWYVKNKLQQEKYVHYEISNFAQKGYESKHNLDCWSQKEYIGIGVAAHSYINNIRYSNTENVEQYIENITNNKLKDNIIIHEKQNEKDKMNEYILIGLRKIEGISINEFEIKFKKNILNIYSKQLNKLEKQNLICIENDRIRLSNKGLDFANIVWEEFI